MSNGGQPAELFQLDETTCLALLGVQQVGRLIIPGDDPYVIPVNYTVDHRSVVIRTEPRPVIDAVIDRHVVFEVDMFDDRSKSGWSVVLRGAERCRVRGHPVRGTSCCASRSTGSADGCYEAR